MVLFILAAMKMKSGRTVKDGIVEVLAFATKEVWMLPVRRQTPGHLSKKMLSISLVDEICRRWKIVQVIGHRDISPDTNNNGVIDHFERIKECPCYDVIPEYPSFIPNIVVQP